MKLYEEFILSKKLKRRIQELCGFNDLEREERINRAHEILNSNELKQAICHQILGTTFKDIERAMEGIIKERRLTPDQEEEIQLRESHPEKYEPEFDHELHFKVNKRAADADKRPAYRHPTREEVAWLIAQSKAPTEPDSQPEPMNYPTYTPEQVQALLAEHYAYRERERAKRTKD